MISKYEICDSCETVQHCSNHGCIPLQPAQHQPVAWEPLTDSQIMASIGRHWGGEKTSISQSRPVGQQWEQICELVRCVIRERYTSLPAQREPVAYIDQHGALYGPEDIVCLSKANSVTALYTSPLAQQEPASKATITNKNKLRK